MTDKRQPEPDATESVAAPQAKVPRKPAGKPRVTKPKAAKAGVEKPKAAKTRAEKPKAAPRKRKPKAEEPAEAIPTEATMLVITHVEDPIGDETDGGGRFVIEPIPEGEVEMAVFRAETEAEAEDDAPPAAIPAEEPEVEDEEPEAEGDEAEEGEPALPRPEPKLERLQKILSQAGIASRRRAEEMIVEGRVAVNGQVITTLGSKADPARDHIRVDGKLLHGAERHRYFVLNKPKGYVTTVSDPEGRPTVMEFFAKMGERLYPVGRLDYQSEGLLLMTNDGELANQLTRAASGVEKTYLVKVAGQPSEEELEKLRGGVAIERDQPGSPRVHTAPARIRQFRQGDNPWFEVVLIEGRNRELRKMFSAIGHFVEKIRRVGYGPLVLDLEPGKLRELDPEEVAALRLAAEGKLKPRRPKAEKMLPREAGRAAETRAARPPARGEKPFRPKHGAPPKSGWRPRREGVGGEQRTRDSGSFERREREPSPRFERLGFSPNRRPEAGPSRSGREGGEPRGNYRSEQPRRKPFVPRGERPGFARPEAQGGKFDRRPDRGPGKPPGRSFGGPKKDWSERPGNRQGRPPFRGEDAVRPFGDKPRRESRPWREEGFAGRSESSFKPRTGGFSKPAFKGSVQRGPVPKGTANRGPARTGKPSGSGRPFRPAGKRPGQHPGRGKRG